MARAFGHLRKLPSGRYQASYVGPDGSRHNAPITFERKTDGSTYLSTVESEIARGVWEDPKAKDARERAAAVVAERGGIAFEDWADLWLEMLPGMKRKRGTIETHSYRLRRLREEFGDMAIASITSGDIRSWYDRCYASGGNGVARPHYMTLRACFNAAVKDGRIASNPCQIEGGAEHVPVKDPDRRQVATSEEVRDLAAAMPPEWAIAVHLAAWCQVRAAEMIGLRRCSILREDQILRIDRQTQFFTGTGAEDQATKSSAGDRDLAIPDELMSAINHHLDTYVGKADGARLIHKPGRPGQPLHPNTLRAAWNRAREKVGMPWFVYHDLRHTGLTHYARNGATLAELLHRGGHSDIEVALGYQHATLERDRALAAKMGAKILI